MSSSTRQALKAAREILKPLLAGADLRFAEEIFAIGSAISDSKQLRNILSDPSAEGARKMAAISSVFGKSVSEKSVDLIGKIAELRWSSGADMVAALEQLAVETVAGIAAKDGKLDALESDMFEFKKVVDSDQQLQIALASRQASYEQKLRLVENLLGSRFMDSAGLLIRFAVIGSTKRRLSVVLEQFGKIISGFAGKLVATVTVAMPMTESQQTSLRNALAKDYGNELTLNVEVDPSILGGVKVQVAGEIIDGSVANRLKQARMMLA